MNKGILIATLVYAFLFSVVAGTLLVSMGRGDPYIYYGDVPVKPDTVPPIVSIISPRNGSAYNTHVLALTLNVSEPTGPTVFYPFATDIYYVPDWQKSNVSIYEYVSNPRYPPEYGAYSGSLSIAGIPDGNHSIVIVAVYRGMYLGALLSYNGFSISASSIVNFAVDTVSPRVLALSVENKTFTSPNVPLNIALSESSVKLTYSLDGEENVTINGSTMLYGLSYGSHSLSVFATDMAGNVGASKTVVFTITMLSPSPTPSPEPQQFKPFPAILVVAVAASVIVIVMSLLVYIKKRKKS